MKDARRGGSRTDWRADAGEAGARHEPGPVHSAGIEQRPPLRDARFAGTRMRADAGAPSGSGVLVPRDRAVDVICCGMYRACSTWQYEVAAHLIEKHSDEARLGYLTGEEYAGRYRAERSKHEPGARMGWKVLKSHEGHECFAKALEAGTAIGLYAYRDVRDVVFSLMHKRKLSFEGLLRQGMVHQILANDRFWMRQPNVLVQRYEQILAGPVQAVIEIANHLGFGVNQADAEAIAEEYSLESNLARTQVLKERLEQAGVNLADQANAQICDSASLLHWNHLRKGGSGSWADEATLPQVMVLDRLCGAWLEERGYGRGTGGEHRLSLGGRLRVEADIQRGFATFLIRAVALEYPWTVRGLKWMVGIREKAAVGAKVWDGS